MGRSEEQREKRLGEARYNNRGQLMKIVEYNNAKNIVVEFQDKYMKRICSTYDNFIKGHIMNPFEKNKIGEVGKNTAGCIMKIIEYNKRSDIIVEFQDEYGAKVHTQYGNFKKGNVKNPYAKTVYGVGMIGNKYPSQIKYKHTKEYMAWKGILQRSFNKDFKSKHPTYEYVTCCKEWLLYDNFYKWLHSQENFDRWVNNSNWSVDKDILIKENKIYSPSTCTLVPQFVNALFTKRDNNRGKYPIGVSYNKKENNYRAQCESPCSKHRNPFIGSYSTPEEAFDAYKEYKENVIKFVAETEFNAGNITKECYDAMMNYKVEITD